MDSGLSCVVVIGRHGTAEWGCEEIKRSCDDVDNEATCLTEGAVVNETGEVMDCFWIKGNQSIKPECVNKVF
jgi:hypothetical protein